MSSRTHKERIIRWSNDEEGNNYILDNNLLEYLGENLFFDYEPMYGPHPEFFTRFEMWLNNVQDENDQKTLFELATKLFYVGREEFITLNRTAFNSQIKRWLFDKQDILFNNINFDKNISNAIDETWFCPITDSFRINQFYHVNQITSKHSFRPDWRSLKKFGSLEKIKQYIDHKGVKYLVLLEDFVGTGTQVLSPIKYALEIDKNLQILFVPLILCENGLNYITSELKEYKNFTLSPGILLRNSELVNEITLQEYPDIQSYITLINKVDIDVRSQLVNTNMKKIKKFGFGDTGGLTIMYTNTPNNSLPLIYLESDSWKSLFKRHFRD